MALSTLEAEFTALTEATREIQWLSGLYSELKRSIPKPITLYGDNLGANCTAYDPILHNRTKYTLLKFQYVQEQVKAGLVKIKYLDTSKMPADGLTKLLSP